MNHEFNSLSMSDAAIYHAYTPHKVKASKTGIGMKRSSDYGEQLRRRAIKCKTGPVGLKLVSPKQAHRNYELRKKFKQMLLEQELHGEVPHCQKCGAVKNDWKVKLVVDHVGTRNQTDADRFENLGILCWQCNSAKGSKREDYRPKWFKDRMKELDK